MEGDLMQSAQRLNSFNLSFFNIQLARKNFNKYALRVVGYARLSFDEDGSGYCSIINQRDIIENIYHKDFKDEYSSFIFLEDDNISGYKFERPGFYELIKLIETGQCNVIIAKDLSRIGRHGALTQLFIEQCERVGIKIITDDYNSNRRNDNYILGIHTWNNERAVKDASEKVNKVIDRQQENGTWFCAAPFGYIPNFEKKTVTIHKPSFDTLQSIAYMYLEKDYGINKIARELTFNGVPTPSMTERDRFISEGREYKRKVTNAWTASAIATILDNDFYNGVFRTGKYERDGINGKDIRIDKSQHNVFRDHHPKIYDDETFARIQEKRKSRKTENFRASKDGLSIYHGKLFCGDCGSIMYRYRRDDVTDQYVCSRYFKYGVKACSRHTIKIKTLNQITMEILRYFRDACPTLIESLNQELAALKTRPSAPKIDINKLVNDIENLEREIEVIEQQRIKQIIAHPEREKTLNEIYDKMHQSNLQKIEELKTTINNLQNQDKCSADAVRRLKTAKDILDSIIETSELTRVDIEAIYDKIVVYENGDVDINLISNLNAIEMPQNKVVDKSKNQPERLYNLNSINELSEGDPSPTTFIQISRFASSLAAMSSIINRKIG